MFPNGWQIEEWPEAVPLLQKHAIKLQEQLHLEVLIALIVDKNEENHVQRMGRDIAAITPDPKYYANVPRDYDRVERNRQKRVELDGMDMSELMCEVCVCLSLLLAYYV